MSPAAAANPSSAPLAVAASAGVVAVVVAGASPARA
jgi:hypothetical protein